MNKKLYLEKTADAMTKSYYYELWDYEFTLREAEEMNRKDVFTAAYETLESILYNVQEYVSDIYEDDPHGFAKSYPYTLESIIRLGYVLTHWDEFDDVRGMKNSDLIY